MVTRYFPGSFLPRPSHIYSRDWPPVGNNTIYLGLYFTLIQLLEYVEPSFSISDSSFGRTFFVATGFHGLHVIIGTLFLIFTFLRIKIGTLRPSHHFGFEASA